MESASAYLIGCESLLTSISSKGRGRLGISRGKTGSIPVVEVYFPF